MAPIPHARQRAPDPTAHPPDPPRCQGCAALVRAGAMPGNVQAIRHGSSFDSWTTIDVGVVIIEDHGLPLISIGDVVYVDVDGTAVVDIREPVSA